MIWQISIAVIAIAFAVLVFFLIKTLQSASGSLDKVTQTLQDVQKTVDELSYEVKQMLRHANDITVDVEYKMKKIDPVMESVKNLGDVLNEVTSAAKQVSTTLMSRFQKSSQTAKAVEASKPVHMPPATPAERTVQSYDAVYNKSKAGKGSANWLGYVDVAVGLWQKFRHTKERA
ncbi:DUF948 domain-containing protein [Paenibacillus sp. JX-17]|uniref:DUF948 domain-containing protein n=1 Tax=Paenibacillus lacisoli TaxID=3064525 RepID=A0ABT9CJR2_9BACL|nr:DUF948 domain-containing protein [Paenibacillus sp. JX-17]MDO7907843.1 DUF948 domain-containing protein [Paenibacillus sp. JX-17]